jgi:D-sedoheptulose 7-phosphate isomerase
MRDYTDQIQDYLIRLSGVLSRLDLNEINAVAGALKTAYENEATIFTMGNGGSASTASHLVCDLNKGACFRAKKKFRVIGLTDNVATLLALANDMGYEHVFVEQLKNFSKPGDVVVGISGSGNSENVIRAIEYANSLDCKTIGWCGFDGGRLAKLAQICVHVKVQDMQLVEDVHMVLCHMLMQLLDTGTAD